MSNTYTQIHIHFVFAVKFRYGIIKAAWKDELYKYITGIIKNNGHKLLCINGMSDHVHILAGVRPSQSVSDLMQDIKGSSSRWVNEKRLVSDHFSWQEGYGALSYSKSHVDQVIDYIKNQEIHHRKKSFMEEYLEFLAKFEIPYDELYIFKPVEYSEE